MLMLDLRVHPEYCQSRLCPCSALAASGARGGPDKDISFLFEAKGSAFLPNNFVSALSYFPAFES